MDGRNARTAPRRLTPRPRRLSAARSPWAATSGPRRAPRQAVEALAELQRTTTASCDRGRTSVSARSYPKTRSAVTEPGRHGGRPSSPTDSSPCRGQARPKLRPGHSCRGSASGSDLFTTEDTEFTEGFALALERNTRQHQRRASSLPVVSVPSVVDGDNGPPPSYREKSGHDRRAATPPGQAPAAQSRAGRVCLRPEARYSP